MRRSCVSLFVGVSALLAVNQLHALPFYGLSQAGDRLFFFTGSGPVLTDVAISGLNPGDALVDIDVFFSGDQRLYGQGTSGTLYTINPITGAATVNVLNAAVGAPTAIDFNPAADRLRIFSGDDNFRLTPGTGAVSSDGTLAFAVGDSNQGANPNLVAAAYINNLDAPPATTLFSLDASLDALVRHSVGPQFSILNTVAGLTLGGLPFDLSSNSGFDVFSAGAGNNQAFVSDNNNLYSLDLSSGALTGLGSIAASAPLGSIAVSAQVPDGGNMLVMWAIALLGFVIVRRRLAYAQAESSSCLRRLSSENAFDLRPKV